jgi:hypothetical protein
MDVEGKGRLGGLRVRIPSKVDELEFLGSRELGECENMPSISAVPFGHGITIPVWPYWTDRKNPVIDIAPGYWAG